MKTQRQRELGLVIREAKKQVVKLVALRFLSSTQLSIFALKRDGKKNDY